MKKYTRIHYRNENGILRSQPMFATTRMLLVEIDLKRSRLALIDDNNNPIVRISNLKTTRTKMMYIAKGLLKQEGVKFYEEVRSKKTK